MKHLFIVNPTAGGKDRTEEVRAKVEDVFGNLDANYEIYVTKCAMDAPGKIRQDAAMNDCLRVYACGGDGTLNFFVNAIGDVFAMDSQKQLAGLLNSKRDGMLSSEEEAVKLLQLASKFSFNTTIGAVVTIDAAFTGF